MLSTGGLHLSHGTSGPFLSPIPIYTFELYSNFSPSRKSAEINISGPVLSDFLPPTLKLRPFVIPPTGLYPL